MPKSRAKATDNITVELNGEQAVKGPAEDRLADHEAEFAAYSDAEVKGPAEDR